MMRRGIFLIGALLAAWASDAWAQPGVSAARTMRAGDMLLYVDSLAVPAEDDGHRRAAAGFPVYVASPWPGGVIPVGFDATVTAAHRERFLESCQVWTDVVGVRCVEHTDERSWVKVSEAAPGCFATVGAPVNPGGAGVFNFAESWCWERPAVIHDIGHTLGLIHEHQRPDRDLYLEMHLENVKPEFAYAYERLASSRNTGEYDFDSIMHYPTGAYSSNGQAIMLPRAPYVDRARHMGEAVAPSRLDVEAVRSIYNPAPRELPDGTAPPAFGRADFFEAMEDLDRVYNVELQRPSGLSINGGPDFVGIAAWIFDVYLTSRAGGYTAGESFYNVRASISQTDEWRTRNPHLAPQPTLPVRARLHLDRGEYLEAMYRLDEAYRTELLRANGLSIGGRPDFTGIAAWIFDVYLNARLDGRSQDDAWTSVLAAIRASDEYKQKH